MFFFEFEKFILSVWLENTELTAFNDKHIELEKKLGFEININSISKNLSKYSHKELIELLFETEENFKEKLLKYLIEVQKEEELKDIDKKLHRINSFLLSLSC